MEQFSIVGPPTSRYADNMEMTDLASALESFEKVGSEPVKPDEDPAELLRLALNVVIERAQRTQVVLEAEDTVARSRQAYAAAIIKILDYLLLPAFDSKTAEGQAKVAVAYVRHIETSRLAALQIGRSVRDESLQTEVLRLREKLAGLADQRAATMADERARLTSGK